MQAIHPLSPLLASWPFLLAKWRESRIRQGRFLHPILLLALLFAAPSDLTAHEVRPAIATATLGQSEFELVVTLNLEAVLAGIEPGHNDTDNSAQAPVYDRLRSLGEDDLRKAFEAFAPQFASGVSLAPPGQPAPPLAIKQLIIPEDVDPELPRISEIALVGPVPADAEALVWRFAPSFGDSVIRIRPAGAEALSYSEYVLAGSTSSPIPLADMRQDWTAVFADYAKVGFVHILPLGLDHILFVVGLFLLSTRLASLLWQVTAFTLAHTVTLALGATGVVAIAPRIVEPLIAASIVYVAIENLFTKRLHPWRPVIVFGFGLLHGLGFAGVLDEVGLSSTYFVTGLIAFNIGVELGQLTVIVCCFALVGWIMRRSWYRKGVVVPGSLAIAVIAAYWVLERVGLI